LNLQMPTTTRSSIVVVGSLNADQVIRVDQLPRSGQTVIGREHRLFCGGKGANQAFAAAKLNGHVHMIGSVGADETGKTLTTNLASAGVNTDGITATGSVGTGTAHITIDSAGLNQIVILPGANALLLPEMLEACEKNLETARIVLLQLEIPMATVEAVARKAKKTGAIVILDPAPAQRLSVALLRNVDFLTPNLGELAILLNRPINEGVPIGEAAGMAAPLVAEYGFRIIVKMGDQGATLVSPDQQHHHWPAFPVQTVDTTGAGDTFNGAFAVALAEGRPNHQAGVFACAAAACSVTRLGAQAGMPSRSEVDALIRSSNPSHQSGGTPR
jgi:ribokinase